ncbi:MAG: hypothetical protein PHT07_00100 [Paludibacter sp.]|nr:hypothetical protein [Paludibacter sp.]
MKLRILSLLFLIFVLISCKNEPQDTYDSFDFYIDSITNITSSSATVKATLTIYKTGTVNISGLYVEIGTTSTPDLDSLYRESDFEKYEGTVELTINHLKPNTVYYLQPMARFNPIIKSKYGSYVIGGASLNSTETFTTLAN